MKKTIFYLLIIFSCTFALTLHWLRSQKQQQGLPAEFAPTQKTITPDPIPTTSPKKVQASAPITKLKGLPLEVLKEQSEDPSFLPFDAKGNLYIENVVLDGDLAIAQGDVIVGDAQKIRALEQNGELLFLPPPRLWSDGVIPYAISSSLPAEQIDDIQNAMDDISRSSPVKFIRATEQVDRIFFRGGGQNCYSNVGRIGGQQEIVLNPDCKRPQILHELLHTLGIYHEQSRPDRDEHIMIMWENIEEKFQEQFKKMPPLHARMNESKFDLTSIMMYPPQAFTRTPGEPSILTIDGEYYRPGQKLSPGDIEKINILYGNKN